jgi:D-xylose transport system substrate-binding protein
MRIRHTIFIGIFLLALTLSCVVRPEEASVHIGFLMDSLKLERWQRDSKLVQARAEELGAKITVKSAEGDDDLQLQQANQLLDAGVNVLIVVPHDAEKAGAIVEAAKRKGVPVVSYDRLIKNSAVSLYISFDNVQVGKLQASMALAAATKGHFFLLEGPRSDNNALQFERGQKLGLQEAVDTGRITIFSEDWCHQWNRTEGYEATLAALKKSDDKIAAIVAANDELAGGAIQALKEHKLAGIVPVSGQDADLPAVVRIIRGTQIMTVYKPLGPLAKRAVDAAVALAHGTKPATTESIPNGAYTVPAILLQPIAVEQKNLGSTVISDGFHTAEEIKKALAPGEWEKFISRKR